MVDPWSVLGVAPGSGAEEVRQRARERILPRSGARPPPRFFPLRRRPRRLCRRSASAGSEPRAAPGTPNAGRGAERLIPGRRAPRARAPLTPNLVSPRPSLPPFTPSFQIRAAYLRRAKASHPDLAPPSARAAAEAEFKQLALAYAAAKRGGGVQSVHNAWAAAPRPPRPPAAFGNVFVAMVISVPLALAGVAAASARPRPDRGSLLAPPDNPWLAPDRRPRMVPPRLAWWPPPGLRGEEER